MKNLIVKKPWLDKILSGEKTWEIRTRSTETRNMPIGLGYGGMRYGTATISDVKKMTLAELMKHFHEHRVPEKYLREYLHGREHGYAWVLEQVHKVEPPAQIPRAYGVWILD